MNITDDIKGDPCESCGSTPTDATSADGERLCAGCAAVDQRHGDHIEWDDDAPQEAELTPAVCGYCGEDVKFCALDDAWQLAGRLAPGWDTRPFTCLPAPGHLHDPAAGALATRTIGPLSPVAGGVGAQLCDPEED